MKWEDLDENLKTMYAEADLNDKLERRKLREAFKDIQLGLDYCLFKANYTGIKMNEAYEVIPRGVEIFTKSWIPENSPLKALIFFCHGYGDTCTFFFEGIARKLASHGYGVFAMDYPGFGLSEGLHGYITSFDALVEDVSYHFTRIKENEEYKRLPSFLLGQSMGGAVVIKVHLKQPEAWSGAILIAPMCKIAADITPAWPIQQFLIGMAKFLPRKKLVPQKDLAEMAFRDKYKRAMCAFNVTGYKDKPRLKTALELLRTTQAGAELYWGGWGPWPPQTNALQI